jgi:hypothetical protein
MSDNTSAPPAMLHAFAEFPDIDEGFRLSSANYLQIIDAKNRTNICKNQSWAWLIV